MSSSAVDATVPACKRWVALGLIILQRQRAVIEVPLPGAAMTLTCTLGTGTPAPVGHLVTFTGPLGRLWSWLLGRRFPPLLGPTVDAVAGARDEATW